ncbi:DUF3883 domain-containing protein [Streptomyces sp. WAC06614]|uniref:DUF3883 domain-containing protein n=1 Tax=Streptomyces sp. WAC06614 TaxID=2487416 RepID=UPI0021B014C2|nr:DUF3883 domain-containing protein [Streptomyces sp. WAC06614]
MTDGLAPVASAGADVWEEGRQLVTRRLVGMAKLPPEVEAQWEPHVGRSRSGAHYPQTLYKGTPAYRLPGQGVVERLGEHVRFAYARLVLHGLARWGNALFSSTWASRGSQKEQREYVLTPLAAFVREQPWLPVRGRDRTARFVPPAEVWHCPDGSEEEPPYLLTCDHRVRHLLAPEKVRDRLRRLGMPTWDDPQDSGRVLAAVGRLVAEGALGGEDRPAAQRANERAWQHFAQQPGAALQEDVPLLVEVGEQPAAVVPSALDEEGSVLYVGDGRQGLKALLVREMRRPLLVAPGVAVEVAGLLGRGRRPGAVRRLADAAFAVSVDGERVDPGTSGEPLVGHLPWLPLAVAVLADHATSGPRASEAVLSALTSAVRRVHLRRYRAWEIELDGRPVTMPHRLGGVLPLADPEHPLLLAPQAEPGWGEVPRIVEAVGDLIDRPDLGPRLRLAVFSLASLYAAVPAPGDEQLAEALEVTPSQLQQTRDRVDGAIGLVVERCYPFLAHALGVEEARGLTVPAPRDAADFRASLERHADALPLPPQEFLARARSARDLDDLRSRLGVGFAEFNATLGSLGPDHGPVSHAEAHEEALHQYLDLHGKDIVDRLRRVAVADFDARRPMPHWPALRSLEWIGIPPEWAYAVESAGPALLEEHVEAQLTRRLGRPTPRTGEQLPGREQVRSTNRRTISAMASELAALVKAAGRSLPAVLAAPDPAAAVITHLDAAGALDFRSLAPADVVLWLAATDAWPPGMHPTAEPHLHGLTRADLDRARDEAGREREAQERRRQTVGIGGRDVLVASGDFTELTAELQRIVDRGLLPQGRAVFSRRQTAPAKRSSGRGTVRTGRPGGGDAGLSQAQREAIGYMGEWYAYHWLRAAYPTRTDESSWVSANAGRAFPGVRGDDGLGFDFRVGSGKRPLMFEVKATQGDGGRIELGESEVREAQRSAGNDRWRLLVVSHVRDPERMAIRMLPNPFGKEGRGRYREEGGALRFSYWL